MQKTISENPFDVVVINCQIKCHPRQRVSSGYFTGERRNYDVGQNNDIKEGRLLQNSVPVTLSNPNNVNVSNTFSQQIQPLSNITPSYYLSPPHPPPTTPRTESSNIDSSTKSGKQDMQQLATVPSSTPVEQMPPPEASNSTLSKITSTKPEQNLRKELVPKSLPNNVMESPDLVRRRELLNSNANSVLAEVKGDDAANTTLSGSENATVGSSIASNDTLLDSQNATVGSSITTTGTIPKVGRKRIIPDERTFSIDYNPKKIMKEKTKIPQNMSYLDGLDDRADFSQPSQYSEASRAEDSTAANSLNSGDTDRPNTTYTYTKNPDSTEINSADDSSYQQNLTSSTDNTLINPDDKMMDDSTNSNSASVKMMTSSDGAIPPSQPSGNYPRNFEPGSQVVPNLNDYSRILEPGRQVVSDSRDYRPSTNPPVIKPGAAESDIFDKSTASLNQLADSSLLNASTQAPVVSLSNIDEDSSKKDKPAEVYPPLLASIFERKNDKDDDDDKDAVAVNRPPVTTGSWLDKSVRLAPHNNSTNTTFSIPSRRELFAPRFSSSPHARAKKRRSPLGTEGVERNKNLRVDDDDDASEDGGMWA